ncbi:hypothetical protein CK203_066841 [Vitis vinifera]|uniref:RNase H type-1 domain-containing protein n=1 Tax=Vitis vinifera TaxID=29760 RepID=A0A438EVN3_VITVI|nr:hypothetical protein CK203_066841 [Vitis vinifera]
MLRWAIELSEYRIDYQPRLSLKGQVMADFIAELPEARASDKEWTPNDWWSLHVDEVSRSSGSGVGLLLKALTGERLEQSIRLDFPTSNNEAEYEAILSGLELATTLNATKVKIHNKKAPRAIVVHMKEKFLPRDSLSLGHADDPPCDAWHSSFHLDGNSHSFNPDISHPEFCPANILPYPDISQPQFYLANVPPSPDISHSAPAVGWERKTIQLPRAGLSGSSGSAYLENIRSRQFRFLG